MKAVLFDLFGTLIPNLEVAEIAAATRDVAEILGAPAAHVARELKAQFPLRMSGEIQDGPEQFAQLAANLGLSVEREALARAAARYRALIDANVSPRKGALDLLETLRAHGYLLGLVTDCSSGTAHTVESAFLGSFFQAKAYSGVLRTKKPDARMYLHVTEALSVSPRDCLYVGDGNSRELEGARVLGMTTVWIDNHVPGHFARADHKVRSLADVIKLPPFHRLS